MKFTIIILACLGLLVYHSLPYLVAKYDGSKELDLYQHSRYVQGDKSSFILSDSQLYSLKGFLYVTKNISLLNFEPGHPPFASYLMGLSNKISNQPLWANTIIGVAFFVVFYLFVSNVTNKTIALLAFMIFFTEPLIKEQFFETFLDIYQLFFSLVALCFFYLWWKKNKNVYLIICQLSIGLMLSSKFFLSGIVLPVSLTLGVLSGHDLKKFLKFVASLFFVFVGFGLGHITFFTHNGSLLEFIRFQRYVLNWWAGSPVVPPFQVWDMIIFNRWHTWWGDGIVSVSQWSPLWSIIILGGIVSPLFVRLKSQVDKTLLITTWIWLFLGLFQLSFTAVFPRHLLFMFLPGVILLSLALKNRIHNL